MLDRDQMLCLIDAAYAARMRGDKAALAEYWEPEATYRLAGEASIMPAVPVTATDVMEAVGTLMDLFHFHKLERVDALVDGLGAAVHWRVTVSTWGGERVDAELYDLWQFSERGKAVSLLQFTDTALIVRMLT
jgi:ketosteroid isomerase-like protein